MNHNPIINVGLAPGELFIVTAPGSPMIILPAPRYLARYDVLGRGEDWMACRVQDATVDTKQCRIVERIAVFSKREQAQSFVDHLTRLLMTSEPREEDRTESRIIRPERGLKILLSVALMIVVIGFAIAFYR